MTATSGEVQIWSVPKMVPVMRSVAVRQHLDGADINADGTLLLVADGDGWLRVRRIGEAIPLWEQWCEKGYSWAAFSPDGRSVLSIRRGDKSVRFLDPLTGKEKLVITDDTAVGELSAAVSQDGERLVTSSFGPTCTWTTGSGRKIVSVRSLAMVKLSPSGDRFAGKIEPDEVTLFDTKTGKTIGTTAFAYRRDSQVANVRALAFSPDSRYLITSSEDVGIRLWDSATGEARSDYIGADADFATDVLCTPDCRTIGLTNLRGASLCDLATGACFSLVRKTAAAPTTAGIAISSDGRYIAANLQDKIELWERAAL